MMSRRGALGTVAVVLGVSACGSSSVSSAPGRTAVTSIAAGGDHGTDENGGASGRATADCGRFTVSLVLGGVTTTACGGVNLLHGVVFACTAVNDVGTSSVHVGMGIPTTVGTYVHPGGAAGRLSGDAQLANELANVAVIDAAGATYQFDEQHGQGTMTVESASEQSATGTFDFFDSGKRVTGSMTVR